MSWFDYFHKTLNSSRSSQPGDSKDAATGSTSTETKARVGDKKADDSVKTKQCSHKIIASSKTTTAGSGSAPSRRPSTPFPSRGRASSQEESLQNWDAPIGGVSQQQQQQQQQIDTVRAENQQLRRQIQEQVETIAAYQLQLSTTQWMLSESETRGSRQQNQLHELKVAAQQQSQELESARKLRQELNSTQSVNLLSLFPPPERVVDRWRLFTVNEKERLLSFLRKQRGLSTVDVELAFGEEIVFVNQLVLSGQAYVHRQLKHYCQQVSSVLYGPPPPPSSQQCQGEQQQDKKDTLKADQGQPPPQPQAEEDTDQQTWLSLLALLRTKHDVHVSAQRLSGQVPEVWMLANEAFKSIYKIERQFKLEQGCVPVVVKLLRVLYEMRLSIPIFSLRHPNSLENYTHIEGRVAFPGSGVDDKTQELICNLPLFKDGEPKPVTLGETSTCDWRISTTPSA